MSDALSPPQPCARKVGFAGLGAMGFGMASNLLKAGIDVCGFDPGDSARERFQTAGGFATTSTEELCQDRHHYIIMVATAAQVDSLMFGANGLIKHAPRESIMCLCCTLPPSYVKSLPARLSASGRQDIWIIDSPVSGGFVGATNGTLNIMIAGHLPAIEEIESVLQAMAAPGRIFRCGSLSNASTLKMLNQHLAGVHIVSAAEILAFAKALGLSTRETYDIAMKGTSSSWIFGDRGMHMLDADWTPKSAIDIFVKDLGIVNDGADSIAFPCPIASQAYYQFLESSSRGYGRQDDAIVVQNYEVSVGAVAEPPAITMAQKVFESESVRHIFASVFNPSALPSLNLLEKEFVKSIKKLSPRQGARQVYLYIYDEQACDTSAIQLDGVADCSVIAVLGLRDIQEAQSFSQEVAPRYPRLAFINCQVLLGKQDANTPQILFSGAGVEIARDVQKALLPFAPIGCHPVSGGFSSATSMYLVQRLGAIIHVAAAAECYALTLAMGVAPELVYKLVAGAAGSSAQFNRYFPRMMRAECALSDHDGADYTCDGSLDLSLKDLRG
ncbi:hypothetical protein CBS147333_10010 [Penicillium roqueforti]|nr:hypothetical protein CBS147333_10010 [Penicillium roqueforti]KAI3190790.1 hypothetical protein CBS147311_9697 [Penicillium roqueforti]KAI3227287.1 hypothetical protein DTO012A9_9160 [Penicillium roqueforti]KAI3277879.1 hypothetical protein DTO003C3_10014 [Penicillium roqueforti]